jgi:flagellar protein FlaJ
MKMKLDKKKIIILAFGIAGLYVILIAYLFLREIPGAFTPFAILGAAMALGPGTFYQYLKYSRKKEIERRFPDFLREIVDATEAGKTLPQAIKTAATHDYGALNPLVRKMSAQIDWGVPFAEVLRRLAETSGSKILRRTVTTIIETHRSGGEVTSVLRAVTETVTETERIKKERAAHIYAQMVTGYTIYFIFLGVIIGLQVFLIPGLMFVGPEAAAIGVETPGVEELAGAYAVMFQHLIILQGLFSGLAIGKMAEGMLIAGFKHAIALVAIGYALFIIVV